MSFLFVKRIFYASAKLWTDSRVPFEFYLLSSSEIFLDWAWAGTYEIVNDKTSSQTPRLAGDFFNFDVEDNKPEQIFFIDFVCRWWELWVSEELRFSDVAEWIFVMTSLK